MHPRLQRFAGAALLAAATAAHGAGLGELTLHSRLGQPLRAEVALNLGESEELTNACFSLAPVHNSDLPVITAGQVKLVRIGNSRRLLVTSPRPLAAPLAVLALRAGCGIDLQRDYVLMPQAPAPGEMAAVAVSAPETQSVEAPPPPRPRRPRAQAAADPQDDIPPPPPKRRPRPEKAEKAAGPDRLVLSSEPVAVKPGDRPQPGSLPELEERILKLETTLHLLHEEVGRLDQVIALKAESLSAQENLDEARKLAPAQPAPVALKAEAPPPAPAGTENTVNWLEMIAGMVLGGLAAALGAHALTRWREKRCLNRIGNIDELAVEPEAR